MRTEATKETSHRNGKLHPSATGRGQVMTGVGHDEPAYAAPTTEDEQVVTTHPVALNPAFAEERLLQATAIFEEIVGLEKGDASRDIGTGWSKHGHQRASELAKLWLTENVVERVVDAPVTVVS